MPNYETLSPDLARRIAAERTLPSNCFQEQEIIRRNSISQPNAIFWHSSFLRDIDSILHCPYYNRYSDKTQVFSLMKNDDITRRSLHVQLVSRIARTIGQALKLDLDLIEAIALGHDIGHPPFAHTGEVFLDELYRQHTGLRFSHSIQSVRVLDGVFPLNLSLQVLDGIACHNGEIELPEYNPNRLTSFEEFDRMIQRCKEDRSQVKKLMPSTLEGAVVRISDIIAYLGKDRQDANRVNMTDDSVYQNTLLGSVNTEIVNNLVVNIIENSYGKSCIRMDQAHFDALTTAKRDNGSYIYKNEAMRAQLDTSVKPMMADIYEQMLDDFLHNREYSPIFQHHIAYINQARVVRNVPYTSSEPNQIIVDYIASMTDDYLIDLHHHLFPESQYRVDYMGYFDAT